MKIIVEKTSNVVKYGFTDQEIIQFDENKTTTGNFIILDINSRNSDLIEGVIEPPTKLFQNLYRWENSKWKLIWDVQKNIAEVEKKCSLLILEDISGTEEQWNIYINKLNYIIDNLMVKINPLYVEYPQKP